MRTRASWTRPVEDERVRAVSRPARTRRLARPLTALLALTLCAGLVACSEEGSAPSPGPTGSPAAKKAKLIFGVWGSEEEVASYESTVATFNAGSTLSQVTIKAYESHDALADAVQAGGKDAPDIYLATRDDLAWMRPEERNVPVDELLDERGVEFGDRYSRSALEAFSADRRLQCMPYSISPTVLFVNTDLVDFERMARRGLSVPSESRKSWSLAQFTEAARFASRPRRGTKGVHVDQSVRGLAPFLFSGGGQLFDSEEQPTSLAFNDEGSREALQRTLEVLRDPTITLTERQLERRSAREWFERGKVAMITGDRSMVPHLRLVRGLAFDVMPMPTLDSNATIGEIVGTCINSENASIPGAADFLVHALSTESVRSVTRAGYLVPVNQEVALSDDFLQPGRQPEHAAVFTNSVRNLRVLPPLDTWPALELAVGPLIEEMFTVPVLDDLETLTAEIDEASQVVLAPEEIAEPTDSASPGEGESPAEDEER